MIQARELMIGNWVMVDNPEHHPQLAGVPLKVTGIKEAVDIIGEVKQPSYSVSLETVGDYPKQYNQLLRFINPIPLTPEILEKAGFVKQLNTYSFQNGDDYEIGTIVVDIILNDGKIRIGVCTNGHEYEYICLPILLHVHQLQNFIYALTGTDLPLTFN